MSAWQSLPLISNAMAFKVNMMKGYILEASPLPKLPITGLDPVSDCTRESFGVCLDHQSTEEEAVNGSDNQVKYKPVTPRYPFVLLIDGIVSILPRHCSSPRFPEADLLRSSTPATLALSYVPHSSSASTP